MKVCLGLVLVNVKYYLCLILLAGRMVERLQQSTQVGTGQVDGSLHRHSQVVDQ